MHGGFGMLPFQMRSKVVVTLIAVFGASTGCATPSAPSPSTVARIAPIAATPRVLAPIAIVADFTSDHRPSAVRAPLSISDAELVAQLFPAHLTDEAMCPPRVDGSTLESERAKGLVVPRVSAAVAGSFTAPRRREVAVLVHVGECRPYGFEAGGSKRLVVLDGARIVWQSGASPADEMFEDDLEAVSDVDEDGVDELVLEGSSMHTGHARVTARIVSIANGSLREIFPPTDVVEDDCPTDEPGATTRAARIEVVRATTPKFTVRWTDRTACPPA